MGLVCGRSLGDLCERPAVADRLETLRAIGRASRDFACLCSLALHSRAILPSFACKLCYLVQQVWESQAVNLRCERKLALLLEVTAGVHFNHEDLARICEPQIDAAVISH